jgi:hypothetical protein
LEVLDTTVRSELAKVILSASMRMEPWMLLFRDDRSTFCPLRFRHSRNVELPIVVLPIIVLMLLEL